MELCRIFERLTRESGLEGPKLMHLDWYDSHCFPPALGFLKSDANTMSLFTENGCTDILAGPDGGLIKTLSGKTQQIIDAHLVDNYDTWFSVSTPDSMLRRKIIINAYGERGSGSETNTQICL